MFDCSKCGGESFTQEDGVYRCKRCGKKYTEEAAKEREAALDRLVRQRKRILVLLACCFVTLVISSLLLPGYASGTGHPVLIYIFTALCVALFIAAVVARILFGRERKKLYPGK